MKDLENICPYCKKNFNGTRDNQIYCSYRCERRSLRLRWESRRKKLIKNNGKRDTGITLSKLLERDKGICHICKKPINKSDYTMKGNAFVFGKDYPTIDHIKPLSQGGTHTWDNVAIAHMYCNCVIKEYGER